MNKDDLLLEITDSPDLLLEEAEYTEKSLHQVDPITGLSFNGLEHLFNVTDFLGE